MYPTLPFGPLSLPTGPFLTLIAFWTGLEIAARFGQRMGQRSDDIWNTGLFALAAGLVVARLWNVFQFWPIYLDQPLLVFSLRPSGYAFWPGVITALIVGYLYLVRKAMDPIRTAASLSVGAMAAALLLNVSAYLTGAVVGMTSELPWALNYYGEMLHPAALYRAIGFALLVFVLWQTRLPERPLRTLWLAGFGFCLVRLITDAFVAGAETIGPFRLSQMLALVGALIFALLLAKEERGEDKIAPPSVSDTVDTEGS